MIEGWKYNQNFKRHQKAMSFFRLSHENLPEAEPVNPAKGNPALLPVTITRTANTPDLDTDDQGRIIVVPIWQIELPAGSQN